MSCRVLKTLLCCDMSGNCFWQVSMFPPGPRCCCWLPSWPKPTQPRVASPGPPGQPELRAQTASAPISDGWKSTYPPSGCRAPTSMSSPRLTSSTRPWRLVSLCKWRFRLSGKGMIETIKSNVSWHGKWGRKYFASTVSFVYTATPVLAESHCSWQE